MPYAIIHQRDALCHILYCLLFSVEVSPFLFWNCRKIKSLQNSNPMPLFWCSFGLFCWFFFFFLCLGKFLKKFSQLGMLFHHCEPFEVYCCRDCCTGWIVRYPSFHLSFVCHLNAVSWMKWYILHEKAHNLSEIQISIDLHCVWNLFPSPWANLLNNFLCTVRSGALCCEC